MAVEPTPPNTSPARITIYNQEPAVKAPSVKIKTFAFHARLCGPRRFPQVRLNCFNGFCFLAVFKKWNG